jgi:hypothetical protein
MGEFTTHAAKPPGLWSARAQAVFRALLWLYVLLILWGLVPWFEAIFRDFGLPIPRSNWSAIAASRVVTRFAPLVLLGLAAWFVFDVKVLTHWLFDPRRCVRSAVLGYVMTVAPLSILVGLLIALFEPIVSIGIARLSG